MTGRIPNTSCSQPPANVWGGGSGHTYTLTRQTNGTTNVDDVVVREGKNFKGRMLGLLLGTIGTSFLERAFSNAIRAIEARNYGVRAAESA
jgi:hypothetical protein